MNLPFIVLNAANPGLWQSLVNFLSSILEGINNFTHNYGLSVILFTLIMRAAILPLDLKSRKANQKMADLQPQIKQINEKYKNDPDKKNKKMMELYQEHKINPLGGCLPLLIQMPLFFALFAALRAIANEELGNFLIELLKNNNSSLVDVLSLTGEKLESVQGLIPQLFMSESNTAVIKRLTEVLGQENVNLITDTIKNLKDTDVSGFLAQFPEYKFIWIKNVWIADSPLKSISGRSISLFENLYNGMFILPVLAGVTSYYQIKLTTPPGNEGQMQGFSKIFPLLSVWFCATSTATFAIYWVASNIFQIIYSYIMKRMNNSPVKEGT